MSSPVPLRQVTRWAVWQTPRRLLVAMLAVETLAVALVVARCIDLPVPDTAALATLATLTLAAVLHTELVAKIEQLRRFSMDTHHVNLTSVWTFAAAVLLHPVLASLVVLVVFGHMYLRVMRAVPRSNRRPAYRAVYNVSTVVLAVHAVGAIAAGREPGGIYEKVPLPVVVVIALIAFTVINTCLVLAAIVIVSPETRFLQILFSGDDLTLELATLCLGALTAGALSTGGPFIAMLAMPPIVALHRTIVVRQLREQVDTDAKTGLLNHAAWHLRSSHALQVAEREDRHAAVLLLDLDHFKSVNDTYGHLYGDQVLAATARILREELRDHDVVGRFGGEEFVVLLTRISHHDEHEELRQIAERLRSRVAGVRPAGEDADPARDDRAGTTISIGGAVFPGDGTGLTDLLDIADSALYAAKRAGRDTVRIGRHPFPASDSERRARSG